MTIIVILYDQHPISLVGSAVGKIISNRAVTNIITVIAILQMRVILMFVEPIELCDPQKV